MNIPSIAHRVNISDVLKLAGYAQPDRRGFLLCPVHAERSPSFHVIADRGWRCFGCGAHGGVLDLIVALGAAPSRSAAARWLEERIR